ncbi:unnamed protein product [Staurois parvus]|uniref:INTS6/SAGE1/DDX26B/CT45 C-terminal domain-containing protein n=1 Tax=Staurois parvus TaxID=386267 RepID=A0ABN9H964_9NEOB|nr:unnamed protein product [Staurois parvus]
MGNYQEYLKLMPSPLREIDPDQPKRLHTFGNPFKQDKKGMMIDEADEFVAGPQNKVKRAGDANTPASLKRRRNMSPLLLRRPQTPPIITNHVGGKGSPTAPGSPTPHNLIKPIPIHKDANNTVSSESNEERTGNGQALEKQLDRLSPLIDPAALGDDDLLPNNFDSVTDELNCLNEDNLDHKPVNIALIKTSLEDYTPLEDSPLTQECISAITVPNSLKEAESMMNGTNADLKIRVMKEVRKPGRNYEKIFALLEEVQGSLEVQKNFIEFTIKEAARFKKRVLIQHLERFLCELESNGLPNMVNHVNSR